MRKALVCKILSGGNPDNAEQDKGRPNQGRAGQVSESRKHRHRLHSIWRQRFAMGGCSITIEKLTVRSYLMLALGFSSGSGGKRGFLWWRAVSHLSNKSKIIN